MAALRGGSRFLDEHVLKANQLSFNLHQTGAELLRELGGAERRGIALLKENGLNIVLTAMRRDAVIGGRDTPGACAVHVIDGCVRVESPGPAAELRPGEMAAFDARIGQRVVALEESVVLVTVALERE